VLTLPSSVRVYLATEPIISAASTTALFATVRKTRRRASAATSAAEAFADAHRAGRPPRIAVETRAALVSGRSNARSRDGSSRTSPRSGVQA